VNVLVGLNVPYQVQRLFSFILNGHIIVVVVVVVVVVIGRGLIQLKK
jgi:hypothetical protein